MHGLKTSRIVTLSGASGVGKTTVARALLARNGFEIVTSTTTRQPRPSDIPGEYRYLTEEAFERAEELGWFLWTVEPHGFRIGTMRRDVEQALTAPNAVFLMLLTPETIPLLLQHVPRQSVISFYLYVSLYEILETRLRQRGEDDEKMLAKRVRDCRNWEEEARASSVPYHFIDNSGSMEETVEQITTLLQ